MTRLLRSAVPLCLWLLTPTFLACTDASSPDPSDGESSQETNDSSVSNLDNDALLGGQSGGEEGASTVTGLACSCSSGFSPAGVARVERNQSGCAELTLTQVWFEQPGFEVGATIGGSMEGACSRDLDASVGDEVFIVAYERGGQDSWGCSEYLDCSMQNCGEQPREGGSDEFVEWDRCDGQCVVDTREACAAHEDEALRGGSLRVLPLVDTMASYEYAGEQRSQSPEQLVADTCQARHDAWDAEYDAMRGTEEEDTSSAGTGTPVVADGAVTAGEAPPEQDPDTGVPGGTCPLPPAND